MHGVPARGDSREDLSSRNDWRRRRKHSNRPWRAGRIASTCGICCRFRRKTAPAAALCVEVCPAKSKSEAKKKAINMAPQAPIREQEKRNWDFFLNLPEFDRKALAMHNVKDVQLLQPLFEFPGACAGCGETPYIKLLTQLFGDRAVIANATGCSSIYGGNLPTTPYTVNRDGRGPAWSNSLFEDNAEFGLGMRVSLDKQAQYARELVGRLRAGNRRGTGAGHSGCGSIDGSGHPGAARACRRSSDERLASIERSQSRGICARSPARGSQERLDRGRRRLGLRHRLWRSGSRVRFRAQRQDPGARHGGVLEHGRADVEIDARAAQSRSSRRPASGPPRRIWG